ncbi:MAG: SLC13 family permease [Actinomycetota bacterium]|nr:SLC13 family permease [Actinomycetota bacterium]
MNSAVVAVIIFILTYIAIASEKVNRTVVAFLGALFLLLFNVFNINQAIDFISWETLGLLFGMFLIVAALSDAGFFNFLALRLAKLLKYSPAKIFIFFPLLTGYSAFMDSITVMLFFAALTYELCKMLKINPTSMIITEVLMANIGGSATLVGDPQCYTGFKIRLLFQ